MLVCGGRTFGARVFTVPAVEDVPRVERERALFAAVTRRLVTPAVIVAGEARGADTLARWWAEAEGIPFDPHPARWEEHGAAAGHIRNQAMLDTGPDLVLAFPGGRGTADMVRRARRAGVPVLLVQP